MPLMCGALYALQRHGRAGSRAVAIITTNSWNASMSQVGGVVVRESPSLLESPHAVPLTGGSHAIASAVASLDAPPLPTCVIGELIRPLASAELAQIEDRVASFLDLPRILAGRPLRPELPGDPTRYPVWGDAYRAGPLIDNERKRYVIVSPNRWNASAPYVTVVRTTSRDKADVEAFPLIEQGSARASCGDLSVRGIGEILLATRDRPSPRTLSYADMVAIAKGIVRTHSLEDAVSRLTA